MARPAVPRSIRDLATIWRDHDVRVQTSHVCTIHHAGEGDLVFNFAAFAPLDHPTYALVVLVPREPRSVCVEAIVVASNEDEP